GMTRYDPPIEAVIRGDWMPEGAEGYRALVVGTWNGFAVPKFDEATMRRVIEDQDALETTLGPGGPRLTWRDDGSVRTVLFEEDSSESFVIEPDEDGMYLFDVGWVWTHEPVAGSDPMDPTQESVDAFNAVYDVIKAADEFDTFSLMSHDRIASADGTHEFPVRVDLGRRTEDGTRVSEQVAAVIISPDGATTIVPKNPEGKVLADEGITMGLRQLVGVVRRAKAVD